MRTSKAFLLKKASAIGWKEDFHMTYTDENPAQRAASGYSEKLMLQQVDHFIWPVIRKVEI